MSASSSGVSRAQPKPSVAGYPMLGIALLMTALAYLGTIHFHFVYDDAPQIIQNPSLTSWHSIPALFQASNWKFLLPNWAGNYYRPVFMCWLLVNRMLWGLNPAAWHMATVVLHLLATCLAFVVARQILGDGIQAGFAALIFGLHPVHIESVAWISGATDSLMAVFLFAAFWAWLRAEESHRHNAWRALAALFYLLGCLTKETALPLPILIAAHSCFFGGQKNAFQALARTWMLWLSAAIYFAARTLVLNGIIHSVGAPWKQALLSAPLVLWEYSRHTVWPVGLSLFYDTPAVTSIAQWRFLIPLLAWLLVAVVALRYRKQWTLAVFALLWYLLFLAPAILGLTIFPAGEWVHDRYLYLPVFGLCLWLGRVLGSLQSDRKLLGLPAMSTSTALMLAAVLSFATAWQEQYWANSLLLYVHAVNAAPRNVWAKSYLAGELLRRGDRMNAQRIYQEALAIEPANWKNNVAYGLMLYDEGDYRRADEYLTRAVNGDPSDANAHFDQGMARMNYGNYVGAEAAFREALQRNPMQPQAHYWLGRSLEEQGNHQGAQTEYHEEIRLHPDTSTDVLQRLQVPAPR